MVFDKSEIVFIVDVMLESMMWISLVVLWFYFKVNLELVFRSDLRLGGYFVFGYVDGVGKIEKI